VNGVMMFIGTEGELLYDRYCCERGYNGYELEGYKRGEKPKGLWKWIKVIIDVMSPHYPWADFFGRLTITRVSRIEG